MCLLVHRVTQGQVGRWLAEYDSDTINLVDGWLPFLLDLNAILTSLGLEPRTACNATSREGCDDSSVATSSRFEGMSYRSFSIVTVIVYAFDRCSC